MPDEGDDAEWTDGYATPEEAALASYPVQAGARVLSTRVDGLDHVMVVVEVDPGGHGRICEFCERHNGQWFDVGHIG